MSYIPLRPEKLAVPLATFWYHENGEKQGTYYAFSEKDARCKRHQPVNARGNGYQEIVEPNGGAS